MATTKKKVRATRTPPNATISTARGKTTVDELHLASNLLYAESEQEVIDILKKSGHWDDQAAWRYYGDSENNFSTIGNQQSQSEAALVEKVVNSIDSMLTAKALTKGIDPTGPEAPQSIRKAVEMFYEGNGDVSTWDTAKRFEVAHDIQVVATGASPRKGQPNFSIVDRAEGIMPDDFPNTIMSLGKSNKLRIPFVQGKFNMGGSGALKFCGQHNIQVIISRRNPDLLPKGARNRDRDWGFTVIRREDPAQGRRSSVYTYLAPVGADKNPGQGDVLSFRAETFGLFPEQGNAYAGQTTHGTLIKLFEYDTSFKQQIPRQGSILERLDLLLPKLALPIRVYDARPEYWEKQTERDLTRDLARTVTGIQVRLQDDIAAKNRNNVEFEYDTEFKIDGQPLKASIYAFRKGKAKSYRRGEGIIFTVNGQTHGYLSDSFFRRKAVGMSYLTDSLLVIIDATNISGRHREDLFMNSRDRLSNSAFRTKIEQRLEDIIGDNDKLKALRERRRLEHNREKLSESKPLESAVKSLLESSPSLSRIFLTGDLLPTPESAKLPEELPPAPEEDPYEGEFFPTFFKLKGYKEGTVINRTLRIQSNTRVTFETDAVNDYFNRDKDPGKFKLTMVNLDDVENGKRAKQLPVDNYTLTLQDGLAVLTIPTPDEAKDGDEWVFTAKVTDPQRKADGNKPWVHQVHTTITGPKEKVEKERDRTPEKPKEPEVKPPQGFSLPDIRHVYRNPEGDEWSWKDMEPAFDKFSALRIVHGGETEGGRDVYDFYVNMDNIFLKAEMAANRDESDIIQQRFVYAIVLIGLAFLRDEQEHPVSEELVDAERMISIEERVEMSTRVMAPVILPMIESLALPEYETA